MRYQIIAALLAFAFLFGCFEGDTITEAPDPETMSDEETAVETETVSIEFRAPYLPGGQIPVEIANDADKIETTLWELFNTERRLIESTEHEPVFLLATLVPDLDERCTLYHVDLTVTLKQGYELLSEPESVFVNVGQLEPLCLIPDPIAAFDPIPNVCTVSFLNQSQGGDLSFEWTFGDGNSRSEDRDPNHVYEKPGTYPVTLTVTDRDTGKTDSVTIQVTVGTDCPVVTP